MWPKVPKRTRFLPLRHYRRSIVMILQLRSQGGHLHQIPQLTTRKISLLSRGCTRTQLMILDTEVTRTILWKTSCISSLDHPHLLGLVETQIAVLALSRM